jgi:hypothetical protein
LISLEPHDWASYFQELFSINNDRILEGLYDTQTLRPSYIAEGDSDVTKPEVKEFILKMKNRKAIGHDGIPAEFCKVFCIGRDGIETLTNVFNEIKNGKEFLQDWKIATICWIYNGKGNREKPENYREITLLQIYGKIFSGILADRLRDWLIYHKALSMFETEFIKGRRITDNVLVIKRTIDKCVRFKRGRLYWCFVDYEKAFDSVPKETLWYKLRRRERMIIW